MQHIYKTKIYISLVLITSFFVFFNCVSAATFGYTSIGANTGGLGSNYVIGLVKASPSSSGTATSMSIFMSYNNAIPEPVTMGIYSDSSGSPGTLLGETAEFTVTISQWYTQNLTSSVAITSGTNYWLVVNAGNGSGAPIYFYDNLTASTPYKASTYSAGNLPASFGTPDGTVANREHSIYVTYTEASSGTLKSLNEILSASLKTISGIAKASVKTFNGLTI